MILILSDLADYSTNIVLKWLDYYKEPYLRINPEDVISIENISNDFILLKCKKKDIQFNLKNIKSYWYRRGHLIISHNLFEDDKDSLTEEFNAEIKNHNSVLVRYLHYLLKGVSNRIGDFEDNNLNKLIVLEHCKNYDLLYPDGIICSSKTELKKFISYHQAVITKPITQGSAFGVKTQLNGLTVQITSDVINQLPDYFLPSFFQKMIIKKYELRIFYLKGQFYTMAIFSQNDEKTKVDFRNYNQEKPNRTIPYQLPNKIKQKLNNLMIGLNMNCGSIDMIYGEDNNYYFLEINPVGQFNQLTQPCNYKVEKIIAQHLTGNYE